MILQPSTAHVLFGGLLAIFSVPLVLKRVPRNRYYGIRTAKAFSSEENWYAINAYGGKLLFVYGVALLAFGIWGRGLAPPVTSPWSAVYVAGPMVLVFGPFLMIRAYSKKLP